MVVASNTDWSMAIVVAAGARTDQDPNSIQEVASDHNSAATNMEPAVKTDLTACSIGQVQQLLAIVASIMLVEAFVNTVTIEAMVASFVAGHTVVKEVAFPTFVNSLTEVDILHIVTGEASFEVVALFSFI